MAEVSQKTIVQMIRSLSAYPCPDWTLLMYENGFPEWFVIHAQSYYEWSWKRILIDMKTGGFFFSPYTSDPITGDRYLSGEQAKAGGLILIRRLAALATTLPPSGDSVSRSLQLDGFDVDTKNLCLIPLKGATSATQETDALTTFGYGKRVR